MEERIARKKEREGKEEGTQLSDLTPVDTALEAIARLTPAGTPTIRSWSAADTALCISTIVGYVVTLTLAFLLHKRVNAAQESFNKCTSGVPGQMFRREHHRAKGGCVVPRMRENMHKIIEKQHIPKGVVKG